MVGGLGFRWGAAAHMLRPDQLRPLLGKQQIRLSFRQIDHVPDATTGEVHTVDLLGQLPGQAYPHGRGYAM